MKQENTYPNDIAAIIVSYLQGDISPSDQRLLEEWLRDRPDHQALLEKMADKSSSYEVVRNILGWNVEKGWEQTVRKAALRKREQRYIYWSAAVVAVLLLLGGTVMFTRKSSQSILPVVAEVTIRPGRPVAELITASGSSYWLDTLQQIVLPFAAAENSRGEVIFSELTEPSHNREIPYSTLRIPQGGEYKITLSDGTVVFLNAQTELRFPESFASGQERIVYLSGEAYFTVARDTARPFVVISGDMNVRVLGTEFNISNYADDPVAHTTLTEGSVEVRIKDRVARLQPGEQAVVKIGGVMEVAQVDTKIYTTWMQESFRFKNSNIEEIMRKLARWYVMDYTFEDEALKDYHFTGYLPRYADFEDVLELLSLTTHITFEIEGNQVTMKKK